MAQYAVIDRRSFSTRAWQRFSGYGFCRDLPLVPLIGAEIGRAALAFPLVFTRFEGTLGLAGLLSLVPGTNLVVAPDGRWAGPYVPAALRGYPFALLRPDPAASPVLCVAMDSGLVVPAGTPGAEKFFEDDGTPAPAVQQVLSFLGQLDANRGPTLKAVAALEAAGLLVPWNLEVPTQEGPRLVTDLLRVDEAKLREIPAEDVLRLREVGALPLAYAQLLSVNHLPALRAAHNARLRAQIAQPLPGTALDQFFTAPSDAALDFSWNLPSG